MDKILLNLLVSCPD
jgi:hypothetical protein